MKKLIKTALGAEKADLVFKNANIVDVFCHRIIQGDVAVTNGVVVGTGTYKGEREVDCTGKYIMPSFADSHVHIESAMVTPAEYAKVVMPHGVTTVVCDPHEIVNVCGEDGLEFMINSAKTVPLDAFFMLPSCVPATMYDSSGCVIDAKKTEELKNKYPQCKGLAEMMNFPGVVGCDDDVLKKLSLFSLCDGHAPMVSGLPLNAYICAGIKTDHECSSAEEASEKISKGMYVHMREGTGAKNLESLIKAVTPYNLHRFTFCTDDKHADEIIENGTIDNCVRLAIKNGLDAISAITIASINAYSCYGIKNKGAVAPGYVADLIISDSLDIENILYVYKDGSLVAENGKPLFDGQKISSEKVCNTVHMPKLTAADFSLSLDSDSTVIELHKDSLITTAAKEYITDDLNLCAVIERHYQTGRKGVAYVKGLSLKNGAVAQTIGHDSHNAVVVGDGAENMLLAADALGTEGGIVVVENGKVTARLTLDAGGIMALGSIAEVAEGYKKILSAAKGLNPSLTPSQLMTLAFVSLIVIPEIKLCDRGLFDVVNWKFLEK